ncbi:MAG: hypothetical protein DRI37_08415 [Chloroflexi bacterium]|nr:MAG: hypothetical protein DRI37_08415 [Chloroflexota bacterium]
MINGSFAFYLVNPRVFLGIDIPIVGKLIKAVLAVAVVECIALSFPVVDRYLAAAYLGEGQIAALRYATFLIHLPTGIFVVSLAMASFPWITDLAVPGYVEKLQKLYSDNVRLVVFTMGFVAVGVSIFAGDLVRVAFQRGAFDTQSLALTTGPLIFFALGVVFYSIYMIQMRFYYAHSARVRLGVILTGMLAVKIVLSLILMGPMEHNGLALATSLAWMGGCLIMTLDLRKTLGVSLKNLSFSIVLKIVFSLLLTALLWIALSRLWPDDHAGSLLMSFVRVVLLGVAGMILYVGLAATFKLPELQQVVSLIRSKLTSEK